MNDRPAAKHDLVVSPASVVIDEVQLSPQMGMYDLHVRATVTTSSIEHQDGTIGVRPEPQLWLHAADGNSSNVGPGTPGSCSTDSAGNTTCEYTWLVNPAPVGAGETLAVEVRLDYMIAIQQLKNSATRTTTAP